MAEILNIRHEAGDLSEYDSTVVDGGDLSVETAAALGGTSFGLQCVIDDTTAIYGEKDFTQLTSAVYRFRVYLDTNGLTIPAGEDFMPCLVMDGAAHRARVRLRYGTSYEIWTSVQDDSGSYQSTARYEVSDAEHYVEVLVEYASAHDANDGVMTLWIDGVQKEGVTGVDLYNRSKPSRVRLGAPYGLDADTSGTFFVDELVLRDDSTEIGLATHVRRFMQQYRLRRA